MAALCNRAGHYIFALWFLSYFFFFFSSPNLSGRRLDVYHTWHLVWPQCKFRMQVWNVLRADRCKYRTQKSPKSRHLGTIPQFCRAISSQLRHLSTIGKKLLSSNMSSTCPHNMVNIGSLAAEICWWVWGTPANFNGFRVLAALLHGIQLLGVSQTLRRWTQGATYIRQGGHHVGHWPTFLVSFWIRVAEYYRLFNVEFLQWQCIWSAERWTGQAEVRGTGQLFRSSAIPKNRV